MSTCSSPLSSLPSSPLSRLSRSPSLPADYPSPPSSNVSDTGNSLHRHDAPDSTDHNGSPPAKRRKIAKSKEPKEQKTEHLDLQALNNSNDETHHFNQDPKLRKLVDALRSKRKIVVIAGAGISVSAGIPDFRSSGGLFNTLRSQHKLKASGKQLFDASVYRNDSSTSSFHDMVRELSHKTQNAAPTPFHHMLATLAEEGRLMRLYTQNVDGIDTSLNPLATNVPLNPKGPWPKTIQLHGGLEKMVCTKCGQLSDFDGSLFEGPEPPSCTDCEQTDLIRVAGGLRSHGIGRLRPRMVLYNEYNPDEDAIGNVSTADLKCRPDAVIVVGTSLKVPGIRRLAREMCAVTRGKRGGFTAWINHDPEPIGIDVKDSWDMVVRGECDDVARYVGLPKWDDKDCGDFKLVENKLKAKTPNFEVVLDLKSGSAVQTQGILTPTDSPRQQSPTPANGIAKLKQAPLSFVLAKFALRKDGKPREKCGRKAVSKPPPSNRKFVRKPLPSNPGRKVVRKPLPSNPVQPSNRITDAFATTKTTKPLTGKSMLSKNLIDDDTGPPFLANSTSSPMRPVSPCDTRNNSYPTEYQPHTPKFSSIVVEISSYKSYDREETISPKGALPTGMELFFS